MNPPAIEKLLNRGKRIRVVGFDDAMYDKSARNRPVHVAGVVCAGTRFEGLLWGQLARDGEDATEVLSRLLGQSKFAEQTHLVLTDGITFGGANVVDLQSLAENLGIPAIAVMRRRPDLDAFHHVLDRLPNAALRRKSAEAAGPIHSIGEWTFQTQGGLAPNVAAAALEALTDQGKVPEALRLAHLIGSAFVTGESGKRA